MAKLVRHLILDQTIAGSSPASSAKKDTVKPTVSFFLPEISIKKKETELSFCLFSDKSPNKRKLILQVLLVLLLQVRLVLQVLPLLLVLLVLQVRLVLLVLPLLLVLQVLQVLLQELQFFLHSLRKKLSLKERGIREIFSLQDMIFVV